MHSTTTQSMHQHKVCTRAAWAKLALLAAGDMRRRPRRPEPLEDGPLAQVLTQALRVEEPVRHDAAEAPLEPVAQVGHAERAVPDPARRRPRVRVRRRHDQPRQRASLAAFRGSRRHLRLHEQRDLQLLVEL